MCIRDSAKACLDYAGKIYPSIQLQGDAQASTPELADLYMFASTPIFEEFVDYYNHKVGTTDGITAVSYTHLEVYKRQFVDGGQHHVRQARHQHADGAAAARLEAGCVGIGPVLQFGGQRPDPLDRVRRGGGARVVVGTVEDAGHGRHVQTELPLSLIHIS